MLTLTLVIASVARGGHAFNPSPASLAASAPARHASARMETLEDLKTLAFKLNPVVGFWDPLNLAGCGDAEVGALWGTPKTYGYLGGGQESWIGFLRHAEIKHGRVAMAAFIGYIVQANGIHFPWFSDSMAAGSPPEQWDNLPSNIKVQFFVSILLLELIGETSFFHEQCGEKHYMRGGKPGFYPSLKKLDMWDPILNKKLQKPVPVDLFDPLSLQAKMTPEQKERALLVEINNGRLAMIGIFGFLAESKVPGAVPAIRDFVKPYAGEVMAPFSAANSDLPFVSEMLKLAPKFGV